MVGARIRTLLTLLEGTLLVGSGSSNESSANTNEIHVRLEVWRMHLWKVRYGKSDSVWDSGGLVSQERLVCKTENGEWISDR